jgi:hypothetical protein
MTENMKKARTRDQIMVEIMSIKSDAGKYRYIADNNRYEHHKLMVMLDNDDTHVVFMGTDGYPDYDDDRHVEIDDYLGWSDGVQSLLSAFGIANSPV